MAIGSNNVGIISIAQELGISEENISLCTISQDTPDLTPPHAISELYGRICSTTLGWRTTSPMNDDDARRNLAGVGTQNAGLAFGGYVNTRVSCTEEYDGNVWSPGGSLNLARHALAGAGTQNAGLAFGGNCLIRVGCTEEYDGCTWTMGESLLKPRDYLAGAGTQNAGLAFGGYGIPVCYYTEEYDGCSWTEEPRMLIGRRFLAGVGTQNAGLAFGGYVNTRVSCTEEYDGSSWSTGGVLNVARYYLAGAGTQTAGLAFGGNCLIGVGCTEEYDGSSWSTTTGKALCVGRWGLAGAGTQNAGLAFGGYTNRNVSCTEEYGYYNTLKPLTLTSSIGGNLSIPTYQAAGFGIQTSSILTGGCNGGYLNATQCYNGCVWGTDTNLPYGKKEHTTTGSSTAGLLFGGRATTNLSELKTYSFDGSVWCDIGIYTFRPGGSYYAFIKNSAVGTQNDTLTIGGVGIKSPTDPYQCCKVYHFNGSGWYLESCITNFAGSISDNSVAAGTSNSALVFARTCCTGNRQCSEFYDGSVWSNCPAMQVSRTFASGFGSACCAIVFSGTGSSGIINCTEEWNGIVWSVSSILNLYSSCYSSAMGNSSCGLNTGGYDGGCILSTTINVCM